MAVRVLDDLLCVGDTIFVRFTDSPNLTVRLIGSKQGKLYQLVLPDYANTNKVNSWYELGTDFKYVQHYKEAT
jgi:hypothetical protein